MGLIMSMEQMIDAQEKGIEAKRKRAVDYEQAAKELRSELVLQEKEVALSKAALSWAKAELVGAVK